MVRPPDVFIGQQFLDQSASTQAVWRRAKHGDQMRMTLYSSAHLFGFRQIHRHPGLTEHMFPRLQCRNSNRGVQIGWRPDPDDINDRLSDQFGPIGIRLGFWKDLRTKLFGAFVARIADTHNLYVFDLIQRGEMAFLDDTSGTDYSYPQLGVARLHEVPVRQSSGHFCLSHWQN